MSINKNILLLLLVFIIIYIFYVNAHERYLEGFWIAENDEFCEESEIESMMLYIAEPERESCIPFAQQTRMGHLVIMNDVCNQGFQITYRRGMGLTNYIISAVIEFDEEQIWGDHVYITINMQNGTMKIFDGDTVFARLSKHHGITNSLC